MVAKSATKGFVYHLQIPPNDSITTCVEVTLGGQVQGERRGWHLYEVLTCKLNTLTSDLYQQCVKISPRENRLTSN